MNDGNRRLMWWSSLIAAVLAILIGATVVITFFTGHYLALALPIVERVYGTQESVPIAYGRGLRLCFLCAAVTFAGAGGMILIRKRK